MRRALLRLTEAAAILLLVILTVLVCIEVGLRYFLHLPLAWSEELVLLAFVWLGMLSAAVGVGHDAHFSLGLLGHLTGARAVIGRAVSLLGIAAFQVVLLWEGIRSVELAAGASPLLRVPEGVAYLSIPVAAAIGLAFCLSGLWAIARRGR